MIYIDASFYLALLNPNDSNHQKAVEEGEICQDREYVTAQAVLGEVLTVGSQRFDKDLTIKFVEEILKSGTKIVLEKSDLIKRALFFFKEIKSKNISWVDCFSFAIMENFKIKEALTFDSDFRHYCKATAQRK